MDYQHILCEVSDRIATITLNRPDRMNAWTAVMERDVRHAMEAAAADEILQPCAFERVMHGAAFEVEMTRLRAGLLHAHAAARGPAMHHGVGDVGMKLKAERLAVLECLHRKVVAFGEQFGAARKLKPLAMPVIDTLRPIRTQRMPGRGRADRIVTDLDPAVLMRRDVSAQLFGKHLRAEANAQKRPLLAQGNFDPVDFAADIVIGVVGAHRAAKDHRAGMPVERIRQGIAEPRPPDIKGMTERAQRVADPARCRGLLVQDDQERQQCRWTSLNPRPPARKRQDVFAIFA